MNRSYLKKEIWVRLRPWIPPYNWDEAFDTLRDVMKLVDKYAEGKKKKEGGEL